MRVRALGLLAATRRPPPLLAAAAAVSMLTLAAGCGAGTPHPAASGGATSSGSGSGVSTCGGIYQVRLPGGQSRLLGGCGGSLHADNAPRVTVRVGEVISVRSVTDVHGDPVEKPPVLAHDHVLEVVRSDSKHGLLLVKATARGKADLVANSKLCQSVAGKPATSCPVLHVTVT